MAKTFKHKGKASLLFLLAFSAFVSAACKSTPKKDDIDDIKEEVLPPPLEEVYNEELMNLPQPANIYIKTINKEAIKNKTEWIPSTIQIQSRDGKILLETSPISIKGRGNSTWETKKKPYSIKFEKKTGLLGMPAAKKWVLLANYFDRSLLRNQFAAALGTKVFNSEWNPHFVPVNLYINDKYTGTYDIGEAITTDKNRVDIKRKDGGFILEVDTLNSEAFHFYSKQYGIAFNVKSPDNPDEEEFAAIEKIINSFEDALVSKDFESLYSQYIDTESFIDWYLVNEFAKNSDAVFQRSVYLYYNPQDQKLHMGPNWDFDLAFGNFWEGPWENPQGWYIRGGIKNSNEKKNLQAWWINRLFKSPDFEKKVKARWQEKSASLLEQIENIRELKKKIEVDIPANEKLYPRLGKFDWNGPSGWSKRKTYQSEVDYFYNWCIERFKWLENEFSNTI